jgi:hypothetical protein
MRVHRRVEIYAPGGSPIAATLSGEWYLATRRATGRTG